MVKFQRSKKARSLLPQSKFVKKSSTTNSTTSNVQEEHLDITSSQRLLYQAVLTMPDDVINHPHPSHFNLIRQSVPKSPVKMDTFLPTDPDAPLDPLDSSSDSECSTTTNPATHFCPSCQKDVNLHGQSYHNHLVLCLKSKTKNRSKKRFSPREDKKKIKDIKNVISKLNLHLRLGIMESFYRLSRATNSEPPSPRLLPTSGTKAEASDRQVLALLYGKGKKIHSSNKAHRLFQPIARDAKLTPNFTKNFGMSAVKALSLIRPMEKPSALNLGLSVFMQDIERTSMSNFSKPLIGDFPLLTKA